MEITKGFFQRPLWSRTAKITFHVFIGTLFFLGLAPARAAEAPPFSLVASIVNAAVGEPLSVTGLGFFDHLNTTDSLTRPAHEFNLPQFSSEYLDQVSGPAGVWYVDHSSATEDSLHFLKTDQYQFDDQAMVSPHAKIVLLTQDLGGQALAWVEVNGQAKIMNLIGQHRIQTLSLGQFIIDDLQLQSSHQLLLVSGRSLVNFNRGSEVKIFKLPLPSRGEPRPIFRVKAHSASLSPDGRTLAFVQFDGEREVVSIVRLDQRLQSVTDVFESRNPGQARVFGLHWSSRGLLSYARRLPSGAVQIYEADTTLGVSSLLGAVSLPSEQAAKILCFNWVGNDLVFGGYEQGRYAILISHRSQNVWRTHLLATEQDSQTGLICPHVLPSSGETL